MAYSILPTYGIGTYAPTHQKVIHLPRKITNMLRQGIPSKIYWYAYPEPITGYAIAKKIYRPIRGRPDVGKIYYWAKKMINEEIINLIDKKYQSNPKPLVKEIEEDLQEQKPKISLTENEKKCILGILESRFFKEIISSAIEKEMRARDHQPRDFDAVREISNILGVTSILPYVTHRRIEKAILKELPDEEKEDYRGNIDQKVKEPKSKTPIDHFFYYLDRPNLLKKLIKLLPVNLENLWDTLEEAQKRIHAQEVEE